MAASDSEGAGWSAFIAAWWDRFGTAPVGSADLFDVAIACDPTPPMSGNSHHAQKTAFGMSISRMRDRVFRLETRAVRVRKAGVLHKTIRWQLELCDVEPPPNAANQPEVGGPLPSGGGLEKEGPHRQHAENNDKWGPWGPWGPISTPSHTRMRAHAHDKDDPEKGPQGPQAPQSDEKTDAYGWGPGWGPQNEGPPRPPRPDWLKELDR
jgi:putative DNA primase/helicase